MYLFENLKEIASSYLPPEQVEKLKQAYVVARDAHQGQMRSSGEPYITHPVAVARILGDMRLDHETLIAAVLHDVIEDTSVTKVDLAEQFGSAVAELVAGVSKLDKLKFRDRKEAQAENFRKMVMAMTQDIRVILIKLADRTHNMRTLGSLRPDKRRRIARETLEIFAPIANRLGIHTMKNELEELGFEALYPMRSRVLRESVRRARGNRREIIDAIQSEISGRLHEAVIEHQVSGREKNLFSIYNKMEKKELQFHEVMDIYAFRVKVKDIDTCYRVLGQMHSLYKPRPGRFKDYIAIPKTNGYQSLHTSLVGPMGCRWRYRSAPNLWIRWLTRGWPPTGPTNRMATARAPLPRSAPSAGCRACWNCSRALAAPLSLSRELKPTSSLMKSTSLPRKGGFMELPTGATAVDFAYTVHTDIGHACVGARVDRHPYSLSSPLHSGQTVEIITAPGARPNAAWLNFVVTTKARSKIRQFLKNLRTEESVVLGRRLLNHALGAKNIEDISEPRIKQVLADTKHENLQGLLADVGLGNAMSVMVARRMLGDELPPDEQPKSSSKKMPIKGADGMLVTFANCCRPIPGDAIIAHISPGKGLVIHQESCRNIKGYSKEPDKYLPVQWEIDKDQEQEFRSGISVEIVNHQGALAELANVIAATGANIHAISTEEKDGRIYLVSLLITTKGRIHLANIMRKIRVMPNVLKVSRQKN